MGMLGDVVSAFLKGDTGSFGEALTAVELGWVKLFGKKGVTLKNIYIPKEDGGTSEIDLVYITQKGIFVIESKNYSGWIFGDEYSQYWTQSLPNKQKNRFYNPIRQNRTHIKWLKNYLGEDVFCYSLIVFSNRCELKKVNAKSDDLSVIKRDDLISEMMCLWKNIDDSLIDEQIEQIHQKLIVLTNADEALKQSHIDDINRRFHKVAVKEPPEQSGAVQKVLTEKPEQPIEPDRICPRCGAALVLRTAKKGANAGNQFYGCSAFPKCRYMMPIPETESTNGNQHQEQTQTDLSE